MRARSIKFAALIACVVIAGVPPLGFVGFLETNATQRVEEALAGYADRVIDHLELTLDEGVLVLTHLAETGVVRCDPSSIESMRRAIFDTYLLREIAVVDAAGTRLCSDTIYDTERWTLSRDYAVNAAIDVAVVIDEATFQRSLALRYRVSEDRMLTAYFAPNSLGLDILPEQWRNNGLARLALTDGTEFQTVPRQSAFDGAAPPDLSDALVAKAVSNRYPIKAVMRVDRATVMQEFQSIKAYALVVMSVFAAVVLGIAVYIARRGPTTSDDIAAGLRKGEFIPYYQPVINITNGRLEGCEVLVRRRRRDGSIEVPAAFIAQAEIDGQIVPLTRQLMRSVINDVGELYSRRPQLTVAFNLCAQHFRDDEIVRDVDAIFSGSPIRPSQLVFEITERFPLADVTKAKTIIAKLQALGAKVALDDAGTGHSGLAALHRLGMDIVKIDKLFIDPIDASTTQAPIVDSLVALAKSFGMAMVAEGVETLDQVNYLRAKGVDQAQGYLFAPPLPAASFAALVSAMTPLRDTSAAAVEEERAAG